MLHWGQDGSQMIVHKHTFFERTNVPLLHIFSWQQRHITEGQYAALEAEVLAIRDMAQSSVIGEKFKNALHVQ